MVRILFVCTGNTCRSPMAEAILKGRQLDNVEVRSAGTHAVNGAAASLNTDLILKEKKLNTDHKSTLLTKQQFDWATHIITMTAAHKLFLIENFPNANEKVYTLHEFVEKEGDVPDPFGGSKEQYELTFNELNKLISKATNKIKLLLVEDKNGQ